MSKVFITKNGQFLSRGEGVLTQIENPDLEVNDIGVEVSEKIAEDVKEGDLVFKRLASYEKMQSVMHMYGNTSARFVEHDGELYCLIFGREYAPSVHALKYVEGRWVIVSDFEYGDDQLKDSPRLVISDSAAISSAGKIIWAAMPDEITHGYHNITFGYYEGGFFKALNADVSSAPLLYEYNSSNFSEGKCVDLLEFSGSIYAAVGHQKNQNVDPSADTIRFYKINTETNTIETIPNEVHPDIALYTVNYGVNLYEYNGDMYCVSESILWKYDPSLNRFSYVSTHSGSQDTDPTVVVTSSNEVYRIGSHGETKCRINKYNTSTSSFDLIYNLLPSGMTVVTQSNAFEKDGQLRVVCFDRQYSASEVNVGITYSFNTDTSTLDQIGTIGPYEKSYLIGSGTTVEYSPQMSDFIEYDGEYHIISSKYYGENQCFYKSTDGIDFTRNSKWDIVPSTPFPTAFAYAEFSGLNFLYQGGRAVNGYFSKYVSSGDYFVPNGRTDIHRNSYNSEFVELSGTLYLVQTSETNPYIYVYEYNYDDNQFYKLADSLTLPGQGRGLETINFSGTQYFSFSYVTGVKYATFDGSTFTELASPSSLPSNYWNSYAPPMFEQNGKLFSVLSKRTSQVSGDIGWYTYQLDGSSWIDVDSGPTDNWIVSGAMHGRRYDLDPTYDFSQGTIQLMLHFKDGSRDLFFTNGFIAPSHRVFEFIDGSGWFIKKEERIPQMSNYYNNIGHIKHEGTDYFLIHSNPGLIMLRNSSGYWSLEKFYEGGTRELKPLVAVLGDDINVFNSNFNRGANRVKVSPYIGQQVWYKTKEYISKNNHHTQEAYGIALQDGSKGDIIKIRRIKR